MKKPATFGVLLIIIGSCILLYGIPKYLNNASWLDRADILLSQSMGVIGSQEQTVAKLRSINPGFSDPYQGRRGLLGLEVEKTALMVADAKSEQRILIIAILIGLTMIIYGIILYKNKTSTSPISE